MNGKPEITRYHAMIRPEDGSRDGVHRRASVDSTNLDAAKAALEAQYGVGMVSSLWGEWEASQPRSDGTSNA